MQSFTSMDIFGNIWTVLLFFTVLILLHHFFSSKRLGLPPGPKYRLPVIGNFHQVGKDTKVFLRKFRKRYGDIYSLYFGSKLVIVMSGYDTLKEAFLKNGDMFHDRPKGNLFLDEFTKKLGIVHVSGTFWRDHRRFAMRTLKNFGMGRSLLEDRIKQEVMLLIDTFRKSEKEPFDPKVAVTTSVSNVICALSFGGHFKHGDPRFNELLHRLEENFNILGINGAFNFIPLLDKLPGDIFSKKKALANQDITYDFIAKIIEEHMDDFDEDNITDYVNAYIKEMKIQQKTDPTTTFTVDQLVVTIADLFAAGTETTSTALRWALVYLVNYPDVQEEMYTAIVKVVGTDRLPSLQDKTELPEVESFMMEILRHAQIGFTSLAHASVHDVKFRGYLIPSDAVILPDMDSIFHDSNIWGDPEQFRPSRFVSKDHTLLKQEAFVPFFIGKRNCLGESLAKTEMFLFLSGLVQHFKISAPQEEDFSLENMDGPSGITHVPKPYRIRITSRKTVQ